MKRHSQHSETKAVRSAADLEKKNGPLSTPIYQTSTFQVTDNDEQVRVRNTDHHYTRYGNPTNTVAEKTIAELEGMDAARGLYESLGFRRIPAYYGNPTPGVQYLALDLDSISSGPILR